MFDGGPCCQWSLLPMVGDLGEFVELEAIHLLDQKDALGSTKDRAIRRFVAWLVVCRSNGRGS